MIHICSHIIFHSITSHHVTLLYFAYIMHVCMCMIAMCIPALRSHVHTTCIHASMHLWVGEDPSDHFPKGNHGGFPPRSMSARGSHILDVSLPDSLENLLESPIFKWIKHDKT